MPIFRILPQIEEGRKTNISSPIYTYSGIKTALRKRSTNVPVLEHVSNSQLTRSPRKRVARKATKPCSQPLLLARRTRTASSTWPIFLETSGRLLQMLAVHGQWHYHPWITSVGKRYISWRTRLISKAKAKGRVEHDTRHYTRPHEQVVEWPKRKFRIFLEEAGSL